MKNARIFFIVSRLTGGTEPRWNNEVNREKQEMHESIFGSRGWLAVGI
jgi:hypothetical protein